MNPSILISISTCKLIQYNLLYSDPNNVKRRIDRFSSFQTMRFRDLYNFFYNFGITKKKINICTLLIYMEMS